MNDFRDYDGPALFRRLPSEQPQKKVKKRSRTVQPQPTAASARPVEKQPEAVAYLTSAADSVTHRFTPTAVPRPLAKVRDARHRPDYRRLVSYLHKDQDSFFVLTDEASEAIDLTQPVSAFTEEKADSAPSIVVSDAVEPTVTPSPRVIDNVSEATTDTDVQRLLARVAVEDAQTVPDDAKEKDDEAGVPTPALTIEPTQVAKPVTSEAVTPDDPSEMTPPTVTETNSSHGLGHSLSAILNEETNAQKELALFNRPAMLSEPVKEVLPAQSISTDRVNADGAGYHFPPAGLLPEPVRENSEKLDDWVQTQGEILDQTLAAFHVKGNVVDWTIGPTVTQFQVHLALGVKVNKVTNLTDDLKLALAAKDIRIEAPIPGKTTVGIEIPNPKSRPVMLAEILDSDAFKNSQSPLTVALGVDLFGHPQITDLRKMPHGLIAGATGSGKSVFINSLLISLLYKATPQKLKLILIDPKAVEMAPYNNIPHLLSPVISDPKAASQALKWAVTEMDQRYEKLAAGGVRNIEQFNEKAEANGEDSLKMPYIVIVIDELADLMMVASSEVQDYIVRITQKARAAGIHLLVATQRPSVDIVTGTIKNNIPARIAFMVSSQIDSRTILDTTGAERLLGKGDMLYLGSGASQPIRLQGAFVDNEVDAVTDFVRTQGQPNYAFSAEELTLDLSVDDGEDELMEDVLDFLADEDTVSTSKIQRVFSIGYNRAANLIDHLEERHFISPQNGSKPRDVYYKRDAPEDRTD